MKKVIILLFITFELLLSNGGLELKVNKDVLFSIEDTNYTKKDFPNTFQELPLSGQKDFISRYIYYKINLNKLSDEKKQYQIQIEETLKKKDNELKYKGIVYNELQKIISNQKITLNTIV
jgi:hypothetical protein